MSIETVKSEKPEKPGFESFIVAALFSLSFFISSPLNIMANNAIEFQVALLPNFIFRALSFFAIGVLVLWPIFFVAMKYTKFGRAAIYSISIMFAVWLHFVPVSRGTMDGFKTLVSSQSALLFGFVMAGLFFILRRYAKIALYALSIGPLVTAMLFFVPLALKIAKADKVTAPLAMSKNHNNFVVISFDGPEADSIAHILRNRPDLAAKFDGFTQWPNVNAIAPFTYLSTLTTKLGYLPETGTPADFTEDYITQTLARSGHKVETFGQFAFEETAADNLRRLPDLALTDPDRDDYYQKALSSSVISVIPYVALKTNTAFSKIFDGLGTSQKPVARAVASDVSNTIIMYKQDIDSLRGITETLTADGEQPTLRLYHFAFTHYPNTFEADCTYVPGLDDQKARDIPSIECAVSLMTGFIDKLKALGVYDNTTIFFTSDHGNECPFNEKGRPESFETSKRWCLSRYMPYLLSKPAGASGQLETRHDNISLLDIPKSICENSNIADKNKVCKKYVAGDLFGNPEALQKTKRLMLTGETAGDSRSYVNYDIIDLGRENSLVEHYKLTKDWSLNQINPVTCGQTVTFGYDQLPEGAYFAQGAGLRQGWGRSITGRAASIYFKTKSEACSKGHVALTLKGLGDGPVTGSVTANDGAPIRFEISRGEPATLFAPLSLRDVNRLTIDIDQSAPFSRPVAGLLDMTVE